MTQEMVQVVVIVIIALLLILLLVRMKRRVMMLVKNKIIDDFPQIRSTFENYQQKIDVLTARVELLERKIEELSRR